jgi:hypothetical protein
MSSLVYPFPISNTLRAAAFQVLDVLERHTIPHQITGGWAAKFYGCEAPLEDLDFDISEAFLPLLTTHFQPHIVFHGPRYVDERWDLSLLTINLNGQEVDFCGVETARLYNQTKQQWLPYQTDFQNFEVFDFASRKVCVRPPSALLDYKQNLLPDTHQQQHIEAIKTYLQTTAA